MISRRGRRRLCSICASVALGILATVAAAAPPAPAPLTSARHADRWSPGRRLQPLAGQGATPPPATAAADAIGEPDFNDCHKPAPGKRDVRVTLKPDTDVDHLIVWISSITCKGFVWSGSLGAGRRKVTIVAPAQVTPAQAFSLFVDALGSVGLTVEPWGRFFQIIESVKAKSKPIPLYDWDGHPIAYTRRGR